MCICVSNENIAGFPPLSLNIQIEVFELSWPLFCPSFLHDPKILDMLNQWLWLEWRVHSCQGTWRAWCSWLNANIFGQPLYKTKSNQIKMDRFGVGNTLYTREYGLKIIFQQYELWSNTSSIGILIQYFWTFSRLCLAKLTPITLFQTNYTYHVHLVKPSAFLSLFPKPFLSLCSSESRKFMEILCETYLIIPNLITNFWNATFDIHGRLHMTLLLSPPPHKFLKWCFSFSRLEPACFVQLMT